MNNTNDDYIININVKRKSPIVSILIISSIIASLLGLAPVSSISAQIPTPPFSGSSTNPENFSSGYLGVGQPITTFTTPAAATSTASQLFASYGIPAYAVPAGETTVTPPIFLIKFPGGTYMLTPIIAAIFPGLTVVLHHSIKASLASVEETRMTFAETGTNVGFSFGISGSPPSALALPPPPVKNVVLFLNIDYVGQEAVKFSNPAAFKSSPLIQILVAKALPTPKLTDGCPDIRLFAINQASGNWETLTKPTRDVAIDKPGECGFTLETGHFSKFAVGGIGGGALAPTIS